MRLNHVTKRILMATMAGAMTLSITACGELKGQLNGSLPKPSQATPGANSQASAGTSASATPEAKPAGGTLLELHLEQEVDGEVKPVGPDDIKAAGIDGISYRPEFIKGAMVLKNVPEDARQLEITYAHADEAVVMPIQADQRTQGKLVLRGLTRISSHESGLHIDGHHAGYDVDVDGQFDADRPQCIQQGERLTLYFPDLHEAHQYDARGGSFDLGDLPKLAVYGEAAYMPIPPRPPLQIQESMADMTQSLDQSDSMHQAETYNQAETLHQASTLNQTSGLSTAIKSETEASH